MKSLTAFALVVLACVPARAQFGGMGGMGGRAAAQNIEAEILEMEQEADKILLKEALLLQGRQSMRPIHGTETEEKQHAEEAAALRDFIAKKKEAITARAAEILDKRTGGRRGPAAARAVQSPEGDSKQDAVDRYEKARIEAQLLQAQVNLLQPELTKAIEALAAADHSASKDETKREQAEAARKEYDKIKAKVVDLNKRLYQEQQTVVPMEGQMQMMGMGGMGSGGFR